MQRIQEAFSTGRRLVRLDGHIDPARSPIDGSKQIAPFALIGHFGQIFDIHVIKFAGAGGLRIQAA